MKTVKEIEARFKELMDRNETGIGAVFGNAVRAIVLDELKWFAGDSPPTPPKQAPTTGTTTTGTRKVPPTTGNVDDDLDSMGWMDSSQGEGEWVPASNVPGHVRKFMEGQPLNTSGKSYVYYTSDFTYYLVIKSGNMQRYKK